MTLEMLATMYRLGMITHAQFREHAERLGFVRFHREQEPARPSSGVIAMHRGTDGVWRKALAAA